MWAGEGLTVSWALRARPAARRPARKTPPPTTTTSAAKPATATGSILGGVSDVSDVLTEAGQIHFRIEPLHQCFSQRVVAVDGSHVGQGYIALIVFGGEESI